MCRRLFKEFLAGLTAILISVPVFLQPVSFSQPFDTPDSVRRYSIVGSNKDQVIILSLSQGGDPRLLFYDHQLKQLQNRQIPDLKNSRLHFLIPHNQGTDLLYEKFAEYLRIYKILEIKNEEVTEREILKLETGMDTYWRFISSPRKTSFLLYNLDEIFPDSVKLTFLLINRNYELVTVKQISYRADLQFDKPGNIFLDDEANIYSMIFDLPDNYRLGTYLKLYRYTTTTDKLTKKEFYLKEKKPVDIRLAFYPRTRQMSLHSFYHDFYTKNVNGIVSAVLNDKLEILVPFTYFEFDKKFKNRLNTAQSNTSSSRLMNHLSIYNSSLSDSGELFIQAIIDTRNLRDSIVYMPGTARISPPRYNNSSIMDTDPMLGFMQRQAMIRSAMQNGGRGRGRGSSSLASGSMGSTNSEAYISTMNQRPDLFFVSRDTSDVFRSYNSFLRKGIYDRHLVFSFSGNATLKWKHWYETEDQSFLQRNNLYGVETDSSFISVYYRHNSKGNTELAFTRISKSDGSMQDLPLKLPPDISLLTTQPLCKLGAKKIAMLYVNNKTKETGLAKVEW